MNDVLSFTFAHFKEEVSLEQVAAQAAMTKTAFCKYFKKRTRKTYVNFLNEIRIAEACRLLSLSNEAAIAHIAEASGFRNIAHFNRTFKRHKGQTPRAFRASKLTAP